MVPLNHHSLVIPEMYFSSSFSFSSSSSVFHHCHHFSAIESTAGRRPSLCFSKPSDFGSTDTTLMFLLVCWQNCWFRPANMFSVFPCFYCFLEGFLFVTLIALLSSWIDSLPISLSVFSLRGQYLVLWCVRGSTSLFFCCSMGCLAYFVH